ALWLWPKIAMLGIKNKQVYFVLLSLIALWLWPKIAMLGIKNKQVYFVLLSLIAIFALNK
ncbi:MAG: hypothetical protein IIW06_06515, partial [Bacteroidaceae bacterium]|nr:hypothetical protein [Bacteroidaceae bacterium]